MEVGCFFDTTDGLVAGSSSGHLKGVAPDAAYERANGRDSMAAVFVLQPFTTRDFTGSSGWRKLIEANEPSAVALFDIAQAALIDDTALLFRPPFIDRGNVAGIDKPFVFDLYLHVDT